MSCLDDGLQLPFLSKTEIAERTEGLLDVCWNGIHPVDIEAVCDYCGVAIVPVHGLMDFFMIFVIMNLFTALVLIIYRKKLIEKMHLEDSNSA